MENHGYTVKLIVLNAGERLSNLGILYRWGFTQTQESACFCRNMLNYGEFNNINFKAGIYPSTIQSHLGNRKEE